MGRDRIIYLKGDKVPSPSQDVGNKGIFAMFDRKCQFCKVLNLKD